MNAASPPPQPAAAKFQPVSTKFRPGRESPSSTEVPIFSVYTLVLLLAAGSFVRYIGTPTATNATGVDSSAGAAAAGVLSVFVASLLLARRGLFVRSWAALLADPPYLIWITFAFLGSIAYVATSDGGLFGFIGLLRMLGGFAVGLSCVALLGLGGFLSALRNAMLITCLASAILDVVAPTMVKVGLLQNVWAGVQGWNSAIGISAGLLILLALPRLELPSRNRGMKGSMAIFELVLGAYVLLQSASRSAQLACFIALVSFWAQRIRSTMARIVVFSILGVGSIAFVVSAGDALLSELGKDTSFTGRDTVWGVGWRGLLDSPIVGYGPGNFWRTEEVVAFFSAQLRSVTAAHNGPLEIGLSGGIISGVAVAALIVRGLRRGSDPGGRFGHQAALATIPLLVFVVSLNATLSLLARNGVIPALFVALTCPLALLPSGRTPGSASDAT